MAKLNLNCAIAFEELKSDSGVIEGLYGSLVSLIQVIILIATFIAGDIEFDVHARVVAFLNGKYYFCKKE